MNIQTTIITIGDELLIGQTIDTNSAWIAQQLNALGINVLRRVAVGDTRDGILNALDEELKRNDLIIITGGLGPTADDITKPLLAEYFGGTLVVNEAVLEHVKGIFSKRNRPFLASNLRQAEVPDVCQVLPNDVGTAPGMWFEKEGKVVIALPGVPYEMIHIMEHEAIPRLRVQFKSDAIVHRNIITAGEGESFIAEKIKDLEAALPAPLKLAYLPSYGLVRLRITANGANEAELVKTVTYHQNAIAERLQDIVVTLEDIPLEEVLGQALKEKKETLGLAESCTGGLIAHRMTQIPGSSNYFTGCIVCYQEAVKENILGVSRATIENNTVVSEAVALEMAAGARKILDASIGFGITGWLSGSDEDEVKAGTVCIAIDTRDRTYSHTFQFHQNRVRNKELAVNMALLTLWKFVKQKL